MSMFLINEHKEYTVISPLSSYCTQPRARMVVREKSHGFTCVYMHVHYLTIFAISPTVVTVNISIRLNS